MHSDSQLAPTPDSRAAAIACPHHTPHHTLQAGDHRPPTPHTHRLEIFVGLASFTACLVAVDKLYLFYATCFYKAAALIDYDKWEPTLRYPRKWKVRWVVGS